MRLVALVCGAVLAVAAAYTAAHSGGDAPRSAGPMTEGELTAILRDVRAKYDLPSLAAAVVQNGEIGPSAATGARVYGHAAQVTVQDAFHIGSDTKSMTATVAAMLVEAGKLRWDTTIAEVYPELAGSMRHEYRTVTLLQLLSHHAGMPAETWPAGSPDWRAEREPLPKQRYRYVQLALREPPAAPPGSTYIYANRGYVIVGAMLERITGQPWEALMAEKLFKPLGMTTTGFGWMAKSADPDAADAPWPHRTVGGRPVPVPPGPGADNPLVLGPAGTVHCSVVDLARYCLFHLRGARGEGTLLKPATFTKLHTPPFGGDYALGWMVVPRAWGGGTVLSHAGSNTLNYTVVWIAPKRDFAVAIDTNVGGDGAAKATDDVAAAVVTRLASQ